MIAGSLSIMYSPRYMKIYSLEQTNEMERGGLYDVEVTCLLGC
jgi:hypothetical protein